ncbi:iron chelate uptake ABC transporter family permease subunit [Candidatus Viridilinea mediisalina]|nr:iron chelate uptake ABC transporter family permease subunit [Candidatus Viridilinea mediisalina]
MVALLSLMIGSVALTPVQVLDALVQPRLDAPAAAIVWELRMPRLLSVCLAGALLGITAILLGRIERSGVRDPGWSGVLALGALGAVVLLVVAPTSSGWAIALASSGGCGLGMLILAATRQRWPQHVTKLGLLIACTAPMLTFALLIGDIRVATWIRWSIGSFEQRDWAMWQQVWPMAALALLALCAHLMRPRHHPTLWLAALLSAGCATSAAGALGLIGLLAGRFATRTNLGLAGLYTLAALHGAALLLAADLFARLLSRLLPSLVLVSELPVGVLLIAASSVVGVRRLASAQPVA